MKKSLILGGMLCFALSAANAQTEVSKYIPGVTTDGVTYFLPKTGLKVRVIARKITHTPGEFVEYAERYIHSKESADSYTSWSIENIDVAAFGVADTSKVFSVKFNPKTIAPLMELSKEGVILAVNTKPLPEADMPNRVYRKSPVLNAHDYMTQEILNANSKAKTASLTADKFFELRDSKNELASGQASYMPSDAAQMKLMFNKLETTEKALLQVFKGVNDTTYVTRTFTIMPNRETNAEELFRFSKHLGIVDADDLSGAPIYWSLVDNHTVPAPVPEPVIEEPKKKKFSFGKKGANGDEGMIYALPSTTTFKIFERNNVLYENDFPMGQFGNVEKLSPAYYDVKTTTKVYFDSTTGAIRKISE